MNQKLPIKVQILNISLNLSRIGEWMATDFEGKKDLIGKFYAQTVVYSREVPFKEMTVDFRRTFGKFKVELKRVQLDGINSQNRLLVSERLLAWANILQHRLHLLRSGDT